ncbi:MAG: hypothetical protein EBX41_06200, partial [Chitinophagia bacterium]|nr:hypothetical protein [Chitinophagia bacterium]
MLKKIALVFIAFLFALNCTAQQFPLLHYTTNEGLPSNTIYKVYRDHKGFIWICTDKGLARYNGISFEVFSTADGLPDNEIFFAQEDPQHRLWFATYNGELCFYKDGKFHNADNTPWLKLPMKTSFINNISIEKDSSVTLSFYEKTYAINVDNNTLHFIYINNINNSRYLLHISKLNNAQYKFLFIDHTEIVDTSHKIVKSYKHNY